METVFDIFTSGLMKPKKTETIPRPSSDTIYEIKYDGGSSVIVRNETGVFLCHAENTMDQLFRYPELRSSLLSLNRGVYVAELCVIDNEHPGGNFSSFLKRQCENQFLISSRSITHPVTAFIHDVLSFEGEKVFQKPLSTRKAILSMITESDRVQHISFFSAPDKILEKKDKLEGIVIKDINSVYTPGKRNGLKYRFNHEETVRCTSFEVWRKSTGEEGIVMISDDNRRINLSGPRITEAKDKISTRGYVDVELCYHEKTSKGFRFVTVKRIL